MSPVIYIMGVSGSGKTTIGKLLSLKTALPFFDADDFHPDVNKEKMKAGHPLTDDDRQQWLQQLNLLAVEQSELKGAIIACSALKEKYRAVLVDGVSQPVWIFLNGEFDLIRERMKQRDHYMPVQLLQSQFNDLEVPSSAVTVDIKNDPGKIVDLVMQYVEEEL
jgi:gluconokinase